MYNGSRAVLGTRCTNLYIRTRDQSNLVEGQSQEDTNMYWQQSSIVDVSREAAHAAQYHRYNNSSSSPGVFCHHVHEVCNGRTEQEKGYMRTGSTTLPRIDHVLKMLEYDTRITADKRENSSLRPPFRRWILLHCGVGSNRVSQGLTLVLERHSERPFPTCFDASSRVGTRQCTASVEGKVHCGEDTGGCDSADMIPTYT